ncbi:hypothetical protein ACHHYP_01039 [Achlya hypogyna]|uniref:PH domain-containing protein n=1 Tax=Achlya hypogyna TaxID=1202772 RepID=A0A1V9Z9P7_ACHHY|nr:hypothetical protein ACHHYP_01039 [Achlya hypogyna]
MQGYIWKRGHALPTMSRRYCVLDGSMLACYASEREYELQLTPTSIYEIREVAPWDGRTRLKKYEHGFSFSTLGGKTYQCSVDTAAALEQWISTIQESLAEPYRIVADEIVEAQKQLQDDVQIEQEAASAAADAVRQAESSSKATRACEDEIKRLKEEHAELDQKIAEAQAAADAAQTSADEAAKVMAAAKLAAHDSMLASGRGDTSVNLEETAAEASKRSALYEVAVTAANSAKLVVRDLTISQSTVTDSLTKARENLGALKAAAEQHIQAASGAIQTAHTAKARTRLRVASWSSSPSNVDALAQGYLFCKHALKPTMHSKYFVLYGKTLCWYKNADDFIQHANAPLGVVHVAGGVGTWSGKVGLTTSPNAFAIHTLEGKVLHCSAPVSHDVAMWNAAFLIGMTMNPLSPERARAAKIRRDSFDLTSPPRTKRASFFGGEPSPTVDASPALLVVEDARPTVEGYLVKQGHFVPTMKQTYCVLQGTRLSFYPSHEEYLRVKDTGKDPNSSSEVAGVADWDGYSMLLTYPHPFQIETVQHSHVFCSAPTVADKDKWMRGLRAVLASHAVAAHADPVYAAAEACLVAATPEAKARLALNPDAQLVLALEALLTAYFAEHHAAKQDDIFVLTKLFEGREAQLLGHLDATYGTTLVADHADLLAKLSARHQLKAARNAGNAIVADATTPHVEGIVDVLERHLGVASVATKYAVLLGNKLLLYATRIAALTDPDAPLTSILVCEAHASPSKAAGITVIDTHGTKHKLVLKAPGTRPHWLHVLQLGIDYARTHTPLTLHVGPKTVLTEIAADPPTSPDAAQATAFKEKLVRFYAEHNPEGLAGIDALLMYFRGKEHLLLESLDTMYGTALAGDAELQALCAELSGASAVVDRSGATWRRAVGADGAVPALKKEGYVKVKCAPTIPKLKRAFTVVAGGFVACYADAMQDVTLLAPHPVESVRVGDGQFSLYIGTLFCQLETELEFHEWLAACHVAIAARHVSTLTASPLAQALDRYYAVHNPAKAPEVPLLLDSFRGRERALLAKLDAVYHTQLAEDPAVLALLPPEPAARVPATASLIQGYLMLKGYLLPSLTRFYAVLRSNELRLYDTMDDAATETTAHAPKALAAVVDWAGSTHEQFPFGLEVISTDHRTYFLALATEADKLRWASALKHGLAMTRLEHRIATGAMASAATKEIRAAVLAHFGHVDVNLADELDALIEYAHGFDLELLQALDKKYGTTMALEPAITRHLEAPAPTMHVEGPLSLATAEGTIKATLYAALDGTTLHCYASREGFKSSVTKPTLSIAVATVAPWGTGGFVMDTQDEGTVVYLLAPTPAQGQSWIDALQAALDKAALDGLLCAVPTERSTVFSSFLTVQDAVAKRSKRVPGLTKRYVVMDGMELKVFSAPSDLEPALRLAIAGVRGWDDAPPTCPNGLQFECLDPAQSPIVLSCSAETPELRTAWLDHFVALQTLQLGDDLLADQAYEVPRPESLWNCSPLQVEHTDAFASAAMKGYMMYEAKADRREGYFVLHGTTLAGFQSELAARTDTNAVLTLEIEMLLESQGDAQAHPTDFYLEARDDTGFRPLRFLTADHDDRSAWVYAIASALRAARGTSLLATQQALVGETPMPDADADMSSGFVCAQASMEGILTEMQSSYWLFSHDEPRYFVLVQQTLRSFPTSQAAAVAYANDNHGEAAEASPAMLVKSVADWTVPNASQQTGACRPPSLTDSGLLGFQVHYTRGASADEHVAQLIAPSPAAKERWVRALVDAHDDGLREAYYKDLLEHQAELVPAPADAPATDTIAYEGFVKTRRTRLTAPWREHYCVLKGPWLRTYASHDAFVAAPGAPLEKHEVVLVTDWHGSLSLAVRHVFRIETLDDGFLESLISLQVCVGTDGEKVKWMKMLQAAVAAVPSIDVVTRNPALESYPGAAMEGYLVKKSHGLRAAKKRYCVLLGTEWLYFNTQEDALENVQPLGVFKVLGATAAVETSALSTTVPEHSFLLETTGNKHVLCEAHNAAEKQLWVDSIRDQLEREAKLLSGIHASKAKEQAKAASVRAAFSSLSAVQAEASSAIATTDDLLKKFTEDMSSDDDESEGSTLYVEYVDTGVGGFAPEDSPMRRTSKNKQHFGPESPVAKASSAPFWAMFCRCFYRPPAVHVLKQDDPLLTEDEKRLYTCQYYANGTVDKSL